MAVNKDMRTEFHFFAGAASSWVIVSVLSVITILCLLILLLFCYKDKLKLLSGKLQPVTYSVLHCVCDHELILICLSSKSAVLCSESKEDQDSAGRLLSRLPSSSGHSDVIVSLFTLFLQETLAPLYPSGGPKYAPCETTKLICQTPQSPADEPSCTFSASAPDVKVSLPFTEGMMEIEATTKKTAMENQSEGSGEPEEVSEEEGEVVSVSPLLTGSCVCVIPIREPLEVGENEDCSQAVSPGITVTCSCKGLDGEREGEKCAKEERVESVMVVSEAEIGDGTKEKMVLCKSETGAASLVSLSAPLLHSSSVVPPSSPLPELCPPLAQALMTRELKPYMTDRSLVKQEELYRLTSVESSSSENSTTPAMTSISPLMTSTSVGNLYLEKTSEASGPERGQGIFCEDGGRSKLSSGESEPECSPESLHTQLAEPTLTSGMRLHYTYLLHCTHTHTYDVIRT